MVYEHRHTHTETHTHVCFCEKWGHPIGVMFLSCTNCMCYFPTPKLSPHTSAFLLPPPPPQKTHSVGFISVLKSGDMGQCPEKSPSPCNTCVIIQIHVLICHKNACTHTHTHTHTHTLYLWGTFFSITHSSALMSNVALKRNSLTLKGAVASPMKKKKEIK